MKVSVPDAAVADPIRLSRRRKWLMLGGITFICLAVVALAGLTTAGFLSPQNLQVILRAAALVGIVAVGMAFVTISGTLFALSVEELAALTAVAFAALMADGYGLAARLTLAMLLAGAAGLVQGGIIALGANPIVTTLGFGAVFRGLASVVSGNRNVRLGDTSADSIGTGRPLGMPTQSWAFLAVVIVAVIVLRHIRFGRVMTLTGANPATAMAAGLNVGMAAIAAITLVSLAAGVAGIFAAAQFAQAKPDLFRGFNIQVVAAVLVGGVAITGGRESPLQAAMGAVFNATLTNFMLIRGYPTGVRILVVGLIAAFAVCLFQILNRERRS